MDRRRLLRVSAAAAFVAAKGGCLATTTKSRTPLNRVEQWDIFDLVLRGPSITTAQLDVEVTADFISQDESVTITGFYDGSGRYVVRFMPTRRGRWAFVTQSNERSLDGISGQFECISPSRDNHGLVQVADQFHFSHSDGTPFFPFGTTCYSCGFLPERYFREVIEGLKHSYFNKVRMCVLPKPSSPEQPRFSPFAVTSPGSEWGADITFDTTQFMPEYFSLLERRVRALSRIGINVELILFYSKDALSYRALDKRADYRYLKYMVCRFAAFRNVWWSLANEYDLIKIRASEDWDQYFEFLTRHDPYGHLRSIHHSKKLFDNSKPCVTHASLQSYDFEKSKDYRSRWKKPIIWDEIQYEGNIGARWGNLSAHEMVHRFWQAVLFGTYATHGETYAVPAGQNSWSIAGRLRGSSAARIGFLSCLMRRTNRCGLEPIEHSDYIAAASGTGSIYFYFGPHQPNAYVFPLPETHRYSAVIVDTWQMTMVRFAGTYSGNSKITLPGRPFMAVIFERCDQ